VGCRWVNPGLKMTVYRGRLCRTHKKKGRKCESDLQQKHGRRCNKKLTDWGETNYKRE